MPKAKIPMISGAEHDALTHWKNLLRWRPGERALIKRKFNKRVRQAARESKSKKPIALIVVRVVLCCRASNSKLAHLHKPHLSS